MAAGWGALESTSAALPGGAFGSPPPSRTPARIGAIPVLLSLIVVLLLVGLLLPLYGGQTAAASVISAVDATMASKTSHVTVSWSADENRTVTNSLSAAGVMDFSRNAMRLQGTQIGAGREQLSAAAICLANVAYLHDPHTSQLTHGKSWLSVNLSGPDVTSYSSTGIGGLESDATAMVRLLARQGNLVTPIGSSTEDGVTVQGYDVVITPATFTTELRSPSLPPWLRATMSRLQVSGKTQQVYVDSNGRLRRMVTTFTYLLGGSLVVPAHLTVDYSDYGVAVSITAPPPDQVMTDQQFEQLQTANLGPPG